MFVRVCVLMTSFSVLLYINQEKAEKGFSSDSSWFLAMSLGLSLISPINATYKCTAVLLI